MLKFVLVLCVAVALIMPMHETQAFKIITISKGEKKEILKNWKWI